jgi:hypothetical protein
VALNRRSDLREVAVHHATEHLRVQLLAKRRRARDIAKQHRHHLKGARYSNAELNAYPSASTTSGAIVPDGGFDWGDAGIGAAGGFAIAMLGVGGGLALAQRRSRRTGTSAMVTG